MTFDINNANIGIVREVAGYSKIPDEDGEQLMEVRYKLRPIKIELLQKLFAPYKNDPYSFMVYDINEKQAKALKPYVIDGIIDLEKYDFCLEAGVARGWHWSNGYPRKTYTLNELQQDLKDGIKDIKLFRSSFNELAEQLDVEALMRLFEETKSFDNTKSYDNITVRCLRMSMLNRMIRRQLKLDDQWLFDALVEGLTDPDNNVNVHAKIAAEKLIKNNINLSAYERLKKTYDLSID